MQSCVSVLRQMKNILIMCLSCAYDAYQRQLTRLVAPVFNIAGFEFEAINAGMKGDCGDNHEVQTFCFRHTVGDDIDALVIISFAAKPDTRFSL